ncbi:MAG: helix-turn-helix domain-containing protein [Enterococcaceae bacterium]|nr:helix-turn-helix domain-containing protein [Enterococcaceae bacterium]MCI1919713.1 helix-turn-helix domain-containing protein [Enterococcaceae bacterium]
MINIGETLKSARENKHLSLSELQQETKIQERYLLALEKNRFFEIPSDFYVHSFIEQYAAAVGVKSQPLLEAYDNKEVVLDESNMYGTADPAMHDALPSRRAIRNEKTGTGKIKAAIPLLVLIALAAAIIVGVLYMTVKDHRTPQIAAHSSSSKIVSSKSTKKSSSTASSTAQSSSKAADTSKVTLGTDGGASQTVTLENAPKQVKIDFSANEQTWIGVYYDSVGQDLFPNKNSAKTFDVPEGVTQVKIILGKGQSSLAAPTVKIDGHEVKYTADQSGKVSKTLELTIQPAAK